MAVLLQSYNYRIILLCIQTFEQEVSQDHDKDSHFKMCIITAVPNYPFNF